VRGDGSPATSARFRYGLCPIDDAVARPSLLAGPTLIRSTTTGTGEHLAGGVTAWGAYRSITEELRERIAGGEWPPGSPLPSEAALCREYAVTRNTLRRALDQLGDEGVVAVVPGRGRVILAVGVSGVRSQPRYRAIAADLRASSSPVSYARVSCCPANRRCVNGTAWPGERPGRPWPSWRTRA
jgi:DNA-binding transcriptional regulator YhcF (GntR family)